MKLIPNWGFISEHRDYFNTHSLEKIPSQLVCRISELQKSIPTENVMVTFHVVESLIKNAEEYIWLMHDQYILNTLPLLRERLKNGVTFRTFEPQTKEPNRDLDPMRHYYIDEDARAQVLLHEGLGERPGLNKVLRRHRDLPIRL